MNNTRPRLDYLDGLRGLAALAVVLAHTANVAWANAEGGDILQVVSPFSGVGVALFFFLSGFCLSLPIAGKGFQLPNPLKFWERRVNRIFPAYYAALIASLAIGVLLTGAITLVEIEGTMPNFVGPALLIQDWLGVQPYNVSFWTLPIELHLYLFFPVLCWLFRRHGPLNAAIGIFVASCFAQHIARSYGYNQAGLYFWGIFAGGMLTAHLCTDGLAIKRIYESGLNISKAIKLLAAFAWCLWILLGKDEWKGGTALMEMALPPLFILLFCRLWNEPGWRVKAWIEHPRLVRLGTISYSIYLWHYPVLAVSALAINHALHHVQAWAVPYYFGLLALALPVVYCVATVSFWLFERPYLQSRTKRPSAIPEPTMPPSMPEPTLSVEA